MPARKDATSPEQPEVEAAAPGNVADPKVLLNDLAATQELVLKQEEKIQSLAAMVEKLSQTANSDPPIVDPTIEVGPPELPEGHRRYASRFTELTLVKVAGRRIYVDGIPVFEPHVHVDFSGGVHQTGDTDIQAWIEAHPGFNVDFWADEFAIKRHSTVEVQPGVKTTTVTPRVGQPLVAPMQ